VLRVWKRPFADYAAQLLSWISPLFTFYEHATPVARERNPTAQRVPTRLPIRLFFSAEQTSE
jgi:hypothetical protein